MEKEERLSILLSGKTEEVCDNCKHYHFDMNDPMGIGGLCSIDQEFCFGFEYCKNFENKFQKSSDEKDICPICKEEIINSKCKNDCFEKQISIYATCPICKEGWINQQEGLYLKCDKCGFKITPIKLITWILKGKK